MLIILAKLLALSSLYGVMVAGAFSSGVLWIGSLFPTAPASFRDTIQQTAGIGPDVATYPALGFFLESWFLFKRELTLPLSRYAPPVLLAGLATPILMLALSVVLSLLVWRFELWQPAHRYAWEPVALFSQVLFATPGVLTAWLLRARWNDRRAVVTATI